MELTDLDGLGPARSDSLEDAGYETVETLADADADTLAEAADIPEDRALDFVVQAQNLVEDADDDSDEDGPLPGELAKDTVDADVDDSADTDDESDEPYSLTVTLETDLHHDVYMAALLNAYERRHGSHQPSLDAIAGLLDDARYNSGEVSHELTEYELNSMHAAISQQQNDYKGANMIEHMDAVTDILQQVNDVREAVLF